MDRPQRCHSLAPEFIGPIEIDPATDLEEIVTLRESVWTDEQWLDKPWNEWMFRDDYDLKARHWVICREGEVVAAARLSIHASVSEIPDYDTFPKSDSLDVSPPVASMNRLVVSPSVRGRGIAAFLDQFRIRTAYEAGAGSIVGHFPPYRVPVLMKMGFRVLTHSLNSSTGDIPITILALSLDDGFAPPDI